MQPTAARRPAHAVDDSVTRWARECTITALTPFGSPLEVPGAYSALDLRAEPARTTATTTSWRPWHWKGRGPRRANDTPGGSNRKSRRQRRALRTLEGTGRHWPALAGTDAVDAPAGSPSWRRTPRRPYRIAFGHERQHPCLRCTTDRPERLRPARRPGGSCPGRRGDVHAGRPERRAIGLVVEVPGGRRVFCR